MAEKFPNLKETLTHGSKKLEHQAHQKAENYNMENDGDIA